MEVGKRENTRSQRTNTLNSVLPFSGEKVLVVWSGEVADVKSQAQRRSSCPLVSLSAPCDDLSSFA